MKTKTKTKDRKCIHVHSWYKLRPTPFIELCWSYPAFTETSHSWKSRVLVCHKYILNKIITPAVEWISVWEFKSYLCQKCYRNQSQLKITSACFASLQIYRQQDNNPCSVLELKSYFCQKCYCSWFAILSLNHKWFELAKWTGSFLNMNDWLYKYRKTKLTKTKVYSFHLQSVGYDLRISQSDAAKWRILYGVHLSQTSTSTMKLGKRKALGTDQTPPKGADTYRVQRREPKNRANTKASLLLKYPSW